MKRKIISLCVIISMLAVAIIGGTMAYFTDTDEAVNVMVMGNVDIEQIEQERDINGALVEFQQGKPAFPAVYKTIEWDDDGIDVNGTEYLVFSDDMKNVIDKIVTVKNVGKSEAWVRTIVAIENPEGTDELIHINYNGTGVTSSGNFNTTIDGARYCILVYTYNEALKPGATTVPSLMQLFLDKETKNEDGAKFGDLWDVRVISQATQKAGFADAVTALNESFGEVTADKASEWFNGMEVKLDIREADDVEFLFAAGGNGVLVEDAVTVEGESRIPAGSDVAIDLNENTLNVAIINNGNVEMTNGTFESDKYGIENYGTATLTNVTVNAGSAGDYGIITQGADAETTLTDVDFTSGGGGVAVVNGANVTINGNTNIAVNSKSTSGRYNIYAEGAGSAVTVNGGTYSFSSTLNQKRAYIYAGEGTTVYVNGGTFGKASTKSGYTAGILGTGDVIITGGTFGFNPTNWVASGYEAVQNGSTWTVQPVTP